MRKRRSIQILLAALALSFGALAWLWLRPAPEPVTPTQTAADSDVPTFTITLAQIAANDRRILMCRPGGGCQASRPPASESAEPVTDGDSWYYYQDKTIHRTERGNTPAQVIIERTPLVEPRGLLISPNNSNVAFWLDNVAAPEQQLTELWTFDAIAGGTKLLAEKINRGAVLTAPHWNRASSRLWFLGDTSEPNQPRRVELLVTSLNPPGIAARFRQLDWQALQTVAEQGPMDLSADGTRLAYSQAKTRRTSTLFLVPAEGKSEALTVRGAVTFLQFLEDGAVLYATQDDEGFTVWRLNEQQHQRLFRTTGQLSSLLSDSIGAAVTVARTDALQRLDLLTFEAKTSTLAEQYTVPLFGRGTFIIQASPAATDTSTTVDITTPLDDSELAAFIEKNLPAIARLPVAQPRRLLITDQPNTAYVDFTDLAGENHRLLVTVRDAVHTEWSIQARYVERGGEWVKTASGGLNEPKALRLYEWEASLQRWILKEEYTE